jgi:hypothetical protein
VASCFAIVVALPLTSCVAAACGRRRHAASDNVALRQCAGIYSFAERQGGAFVTVRVHARGARDCVVTCRLLRALQSIGGLSREAELALGVTGVQNDIASSEKNIRIRPGEAMLTFRCTSVRRSLTTLPARLRVPMVRCRLAVSAHRRDVQANLRRGGHVHRGANEASQRRGGCTAGEGPAVAEW